MRCFGGWCLIWLLLMLVGGVGLIADYWFGFVVVLLLVRVALLGWLISALCLLVFRFARFVFRLWVGWFVGFTCIVMLGGVALIVLSF